MKQNILMRLAAVIGTVIVVGLQPVAAQNVATTDSTVVKQGNLTITLNATGSLAPVQELLADTSS